MKCFSLGTLTFFAYCFINAKVLIWPKHSFYLLSGLYPFGAYFKRHTLSLKICKKKGKMCFKNTKHIAFIMHRQKMLGFPIRRDFLSPFIIRPFNSVIENPLSFGNYHGIIFFTRGRRNHGILIKLH